MNDATPSYEDKGFILDGGAFIKSLKVAYRPEGHAARKVSIVTDEGDTLSLPVKMAETLAMDIVKALYEHDSISMDAAGLLHTMSLTVLQDPREALEAAMMEAGEDF